MKWDDIKVFLAVAEAGSTLAASKSLGVNQTTMALLHKPGVGRGSPFPGRTYPSAAVTGIPSAV